MDRQELARFLRASRERMEPLGQRRRTPGLRREEVAERAGMSTDYYTRLEQARGPHPSAAVVGGLARALELSRDERDHLFRLAEVPVPAEPAAAVVRPGLMILLDRLRDDCAVVITDAGDLLAWTPLAALVFPDVDSGANLLRSFFLLGGSDRIPAEDREEIGRAHVADLRASLARRPELQSLVSALLVSPWFARLWAAQEVAVRRVARKRIVHPDVGVLEFDCEVLASVEGDQRLVLHTAPPGSVTADRLEQLKAPDREIGSLQPGKI